MSTRPISDDRIEQLLDLLATMGTDGFANNVVPKDELVSLLLELKWKRATSNPGSALMEER